MSSITITDVRYTKTHKLTHCGCTECWGEHRLYERTVHIIGCGKLSFTLGRVTYKFWDDSGKVVPFHPIPEK